MAIAHFEVNIFTRSKGDQIVMKAAYRAGEVLHDERVGLTFNYTRKRGVDERFILAPPGAPRWALDRETLWNAVEQSEGRADSQLARELEISLPIELTHEQQRELLESFISEHYVARGMVADCVIHRPTGKHPHASEFGDQVADDHSHNPHAHVLVTMRELTRDGFGNKRRDWNDWDLKTNSRAAWELAANRALATAGRRERIDMRSFADRGVELEPQLKRYRASNEVDTDGRGHVLERRLEALLVARRNGERVIARPECILELLSSKQSVFTEHQILRALHRYTADAQQFERARMVLFASPELVPISSDTGPRRYSTRTVVETERELLTDAHMLAQRAGHQVERALVNAALASSPRKLSDEQAAAVRHLASTGDLVLVRGYAGTGKSTMLGAARAAWEAAGYKVVGGAIAGIAADGLADPKSAGIPSRTLASWQFAWDNGRDLLTSQHVLVIDEAGMVGTRQLSAVIARARAAGAKVVLVGDTRQLQAIEPGAPMRVLQDRYGAAQLTKVIRQDAHAWQAQATQAFAQGNADGALRTYIAEQRTVRCHDANAAHRALIDRWASDRFLAPTETAIVLAYRRKDVHALNQLARALRVERGELGPDHTFETKQGTRSFAQGDRIYFLANDRQLNVKNGSLATIESIVGTRLTVRLDDHRQLTFDASVYKAIDHGYAATIHKSQGVTVDRAYVLASRYMDAAATYVALSRHRKDAHLFYSAREFSDEKALLRKLAKQRERAMALDAVSAVPSPAQLDRCLTAEDEFLSLSTEEQLARIERLQLIGERNTRSAAEVLEMLPDVRAAVVGRDEAAARLASALRQLDDFREQHRIATELRTPAFRALEAGVESAQRALLSAERALHAVRTSPARRAAAERLAGRHNLAIKRARERWQWCNNLRQRRERDLAIGRYADAYNAQLGAVRYRAAERSDEGKSFEVLLKREVRGAAVFVLRPLNSPGPFVIADARLFAEEPLLGTSAVLVGRAEPTRPQEKGKSDERNRPRS